MHSLDLSACRKFTSCCVCLVADWNIPLFLRVHELALRDHCEYAGLTKWLNTEIEKANVVATPTEQRSFITKQQLVVHFTSHIPVEELARSKMSVVTPADVKGQIPLDPVVQRKLQELTEHAAALGVSDLDDFQRYHATLRRMEARFNELDLLFKDGVLPSKDLLLAYKAFGDSVTSRLSESIKMRQQERILLNAITSTLDTMTMGSLQHILRNVERAVVELRPLLTQPERADLILATLRESVAISLSSNAKTALDHLKSILRVA